MKALWMAFWVIAAIATFVLMLSEYAVAHEWYPTACCDQRDCREVYEGEVVETPEGWYLPEMNVTIGYADAFPSPDEHYHICTMQYSALIEGQAVKRESLRTWQGGKPCFFVPGSS